jgi:hemerythrin
LDQVAEPGSAVEVVQRLKDYTESHFALEEEYMRILDYPGREAHVRAHDKFRAELEQMSVDAGEHDDISRQVISTFLREWLTRHIFGIDKELEAFLLDSGVH